jgi:hypothetical protein
MRRIAVLAWTLAILSLPTDASAAITATNDGPTLAGTLGGGLAVTAATMSEVPTGTPNGTGDSTLAGFPTEGGTFAILTSGDVASADDAGAFADTDLGSGPAHGFGGADGNADDTSVLSIDFHVPSGMNCVALDYRFLSEEYPDNVGATVSDGFLALLDDPTWSADLTADIAAPSNIALDADGHLISVNTTTFTDTTPVGSVGSDTAYAGTTPLLTARHPVAAGSDHTLRLVLFDQGDHALDSAVFLDNLRFGDLAPADCGGSPDRTPPAVTLEEGDVGADRVFSGTGGTDANDSTQVTTQVYAVGSSTPVEIASTGVDPDTGSWQLTGGPLPPGNYTAQSHQTDKSGNVGLSSVIGFTVASDATAPEVVIEDPGPGAVSLTASPTISGIAGIDPGDVPSVTVEVHRGSSAAGELADSVGAPADDGDWSATVGPLANGTYTVVARQTDVSGNEGVSDPVTFRVAVPEQTPTPTPTPAVTPTPTPTPEPGPQPRLGETVVVGTVSGTIRIKGRNGKFRTLGRNEAIPLGSTVDATKGRVRLTSAAAPGGKTQTADFYQGSFVITQTAGKKPITQLALAGALNCKAKSPKASAAATRKKVRRLWGDGKGRFRTKGRRAAATVRGTKWLTEDRCDSTRITVKRGVVSVRDFKRRKTVVVKKGHSYVARAKRKTGK